MTDAQLNTLISEFRTDYQIPPYYNDSTLTNAAKSSEAFFTRLEDGADFVTDHEARQLLKCRMYYDIYHNLDQFMKNYSQDVIGWQLSQASRETEDTEDDEET